MRATLRLFRAAAVAAVAVALAVSPPRRLAAQTTPQQKQVKYVRDAEEYAVLSRMVYRQALAALTAAVRERSARVSGPWAVVLDIDETVLDNSTYELDRASYGLPFENASWNAWVERAEAGVVPGVQTFIAEVRRLGGHVAYISNRDEAVRAATQANLVRFNLWTDLDRLCLITDTSYTKRVRRAEVADGRGACSWNTPTPVLVYVGDQMGDFPAAGERDVDAGKDDAFGRRYFILPNPLYGAWTTRVTRQR
ncbi:MAG TPA: HAD family acid phosphatase [Gemmatimonadales bacterium]|nr:HAD family acid phosphatase [Gemmatimonadales bacterium]